MAINFSVTSVGGIANSQAIFLRKSRLRFDLSVSAWLRSNAQFEQSPRMPGLAPASPIQFVWVVSGWGGQANGPDEFNLYAEDVDDDSMSQLLVRSSATTRLLPDSAILLVSHPFILIGNGTNTDI
ncbi:MAG TPA: hypothetical protein PLN21_05635 [Gemmatales bacterium]|nr:hypothetical protein [Gemmatales bacterium]